MTVDELMQAIRDSGVAGSARVIIGREGKRVSERAADTGCSPLYGVRPVTGCSETVDGDALAILYEAP